MTSEIEKKKTEIESRIINVIKCLSFSQYWSFKILLLAHFWCRFEMDIDKPETEVMVRIKFIYILTLHVIAMFTYLSLIAFHST